MAISRPPRADGPAAQEFVLRTGPGRARASVLMIIVLVPLVVAVTWNATRFRHQSGAAAQVPILASVLVATAALWVVVRRVEWLVARRGRRRRPMPAMRLSPAGLDYSPAFTGDFPVHVDWASARSCRYRRGPGGGRFWCLDAEAVDGLGPLPSGLPRRSMVGPDRARAVATGQARIAADLGDEPEDVDLLTHLLAFGTPIALDLALVEGVPLRDVDLRLREWTGGRCSLRRSVIGFATAGVRSGSCRLLS